MLYSCTTVLMFRLSLALGIGLISWSASQAHASVVEGLDLEELVEGADEISLTEVLERVSYWKGRSIVTRYRLRVHDPVKGRCVPGDEIFVETLGGQVGDVALKVEGVPSFEVGKRALVFLRGNADGVLRSVGMAQGVMRVAVEGSETYVVPDNRGLVLVRRGPNGQIQSKAAALEKRQALHIMMARLRGIVDRARQ